MPNVLDNITRRKVVQDWLENGDSYSQVATRCNVTRHTVARVIEDYEDFGTHERQPESTRGLGLRRDDAVIDAAGLIWINTMVHAYPVMYNWQYVHVYNHHHPGQSISCQNLRNALTVHVSG